MGVSFKDLNLTLNDEVKIFTFNNISIEVKQHISTINKNDLIQIALQKSAEGTIYNDILTDVFFHLNIVYLYTNIEFSEEDKADELDLYDKIHESGLLNAILSHMDEDEYNSLVNIMNTEIDKRIKYNNSAAAVLQSFIQDLPVNAAAAADIVNGWDAEKFQSVQDMINLARKAGINPAISEVSSEDNLVNFLEEQAKAEEKE